MSGVLGGGGAVAGVRSVLGLAPVAGPFIKGSAIILGIFLVYFLLTWRKVRKAAGRRVQSAALARRLGLRYSTGDPLGCARLPFDALRRGEGRGAENVMWGSWRGLDVRAFDFWFWVEASDGQATSRALQYLSCAVTPLPVRGPTLTIARHQALEDFGALGPQTVTFESEDFNRAFHVRCADAKFATDVVDPRMMQWLLSTTGGDAIEISGGWLLVWHRQVKPRAVATILQTLQGFVEHVPRVVYDLYAPPEGAGDGRDHAAAGVDADGSASRDAAPATGPTYMWQQRWAQIAAAIFVAAWAGMWIVAGFQCSSSPSCEGSAVATPSASLAGATNGPIPVRAMPAGDRTTLTLPGLDPGERLTVTVRGVAVPPQARAGRPGSRTVGVLLALRNTGTVRYYASLSSGERMVDADGTRYRANGFEPFLPEQDILNLRPGEDAAAYAWFDLPPGARPVAFLLRPDAGFGPRPGRWPLPPLPAETPAAGGF